jgi:hypothetical protein
MEWLRELWTSVRDAVFVAAQVVTLGVLALVLGLLALNVLAQRPPPTTSPSSQPSRPLVALVPTLVPDTPTVPPASPAAAAAGAPTTAARPAESPTAEPTRPVEGAPPRPEPAPPPAPPVPPPPAPTRAAEPSPAAAPAGTPTARPSEGAPAPTPPGAPPAAVAGQPIKVLPTADGLPARVRAEPSARAPILVRVPLGSTVELLGTTNGEELQPGNSKWVRIKWRGTTGYVYSTLVGDP